MIREPRRCAGSKNSWGVGWMTVPYDRAMDRVFDRLEDRAAPIVPEDSAKAAAREDESS